MENALNEVEFKGSPLYNELKYCSFPTNFYVLTKLAHENKPNSVFWKEAFEMIDARYKKYLKKIKANETCD